MTVLADDRVTRTRNKTGMAQYTVPVVASDIIYQGGLVSYNAAGHAIPAADTANTFFLGLADEQADNSSGSAADINVRVHSFLDALLVASSVTLAMNGEIMYIVDDQTVDDAAGPTNDIACGIQTEFVSSTSCWVRLTPTSLINV